MRPPSLKTYENSPRDGRVPGPVFFEDQTLRPSATQKILPA
jgi:hypothetical protein